MKADLESVILKITKFLNADFPKEKMAEFLDHLSVEKFRKNNAVNMTPPKGTMPEEVTYSCYHLLP